MNFLHAVGKLDVLHNDETTHPQKRRKRDLPPTLHLDCTFVACKSERIIGSTRGWRDLTCMSQKHQVNMSLTSEEVHEVLSDITIGCKDSAYSRRSRRSWRAWGPLSSVRHQVLENTLV